MSHDTRSTHAAGHQEISALLPWYVNGSIGDRDREQVDAHLAACGRCREELEEERRVFQGMTAETSVEYMPTASLKRLQARLDELDGSIDATPAPPITRSRRQSMPWQGVMAASVAVMAVAVSLLAADRWVRFRAHAATADYYTVTTPVARPRGEVIRAVFSPTLTLVELQSILDESRLRIIAGPTEAGVYSLAATSSQSVSASLALLREHADVRFAESTQPQSGAGPSP